MDASVEPVSKKIIILTDNPVKASLGPRRYKSNTGVVNAMYGIITCFIANVNIACIVENILVITIH